MHAILLIQNINEMEEVLSSLKKQEEKLQGIEDMLSSSKTVLNLNEVSILTGISKSSLYKFTHRKEIPHFKQAKHLYFDRREIEDWLRTNRVPTITDLDREAPAALRIKRGGGAR